MPLRKPQPKELIKPQFKEPVKPIKPLKPKDPVNDDDDEEHKQRRNTAKEIKTLEGIVIQLMDRITELEKKPQKVDNGLCLTSLKKQDLLDATNKYITQYHRNEDPTSKHYVVNEQSSVRCKLRRMKALYDEIAQIPTHDP